MIKRVAAIHLAGVTGAWTIPRGQHYPRSTGEFQAWFRTDADCLDYLEWLRWPTASPARSAFTRGAGGGRWPV